MDTIELRRCFGLWVSLAGILNQPQVVWRLREDYGGSALCPVHSGMSRSPSAATRGGGGCPITCWPAGIWAIAVSRNSMNGAENCAALMQDGGDLADDGGDILSALAGSQPERLIETDQPIGGIAPSLALDQPYRYGQPKRKGSPCRSRLNLRSAAQA